MTHTRAPRSASPLLCAAALGLWAGACGPDPGVGAGEPVSAPPPRIAAPVEVAPIEVGEIASRRAFSGALEAAAEYVVAAKVGGRIREARVDLGDSVLRGDVLFILDDEEHVQAVRQAEADLAVAEANVTQAESALEIAQRSLERIELLRARGVTSEAEQDAARADHLSGKARLAVTRAQVARAEAALETAHIRLAYTRVTADWTGADEERVVAARYVDEGDSVSANGPLLAIVELDPLTGVFHVPERDYARLRAEQPVTVTAQAWPGESFEGRVARIAPVFRESTRQARVELRIPNADQRLKPGMFVRVEVELERLSEATLVPQSALTERADEIGVFVVAAGELSVTWRPVTVDVLEGGRAAIRGEGLEGRVVTLGQQLIEDGAPIVIPEAAAGGSAE